MSCSIAQLDIKTKIQPHDTFPCPIPYGLTGVIERIGACPPPSATTKETL